MPRHQYWKSPKNLCAQNKKALLTQEKVPPYTTWDQQLHELSPHYLLAEDDQADATQFPTSIP